MRANARMGLEKTEDGRIAKLFDCLRPARQCLSLISLYHQRTMEIEAELSGLWMPLFERLSPADLAVISNVANSKLPSRPDPSAESVLRGLIMEGRFTGRSSDFATVKQLLNLLKKPELVQYAPAYAAFPLLGELPNPLHKSEVSSSLETISVSSRDLEYNELSSTLELKKSLTMPSGDKQRPKFKLPPLHRAKEKESAVRISLFVATLDT